MIRNEEHKLRPSGWRVLKDNRTVFLILLLYAFGLLFCMSGDSPFRISVIRGDSSWFLMAGKAWMEGLTPYVDFADSKGPLLWLIYGLGSLISPHSFAGVFIFEVIFYWIAFCFLFLTARIFLENRAQCIMACILMGIFYFYPALHQEMRVEDFCHIFNAAVFYVLLKIIFRNSFNKEYSWIIGICLGCTLMMKYSYFLTLLIPAFFILLYIWKSHRILTFKFLLGILGGFSVIVVPFLIYFLAIGAMEGFYEEYFYNTVRTIIGVKEYDDSVATDFKHRWPFVIWYFFRKNHYFSFYMWFVLIGLIVSIIRFRKNIWLVVSLCCWYGLSILLFALLGEMNYRYYFMLSIFLYPALIMLCGCFKQITMAGSIIGGACVIAGMTLFSTDYIYNELRYPKRDLVVLAELKKVAYIINEKERQTGRRPTIAYFNIYDMGDHILTNALPGTKYWALQLGMTEDMLKQYEEDILYRKRPDFVITGDKEIESQEQLESNGYHRRLIYQFRPPTKTEAPWILYLYEKDSDK